MCCFLSLKKKIFTYQQEKRALEMLLNVEFKIQEIMGFFRKIVLIVICYVYVLLVQL